MVTRGNCFTVWCWWDLFQKRLPIRNVTSLLSRNGNFHYYASAFRRRRHYVFGLSVRPSVRPSVRSLKYPLLTCTWVRWSTRPTLTVLRHVRPSVRLSVRPSVRPSVCPSVRPERFPGICRRMHGGNGLKFYMLMYLDHLQNWLVYDHGLLIFYNFGAILT